MMAIPQKGAKLTQHTRVLRTILTPLFVLPRDFLRVHANGKQDLNE